MNNILIALIYLGAGIMVSFILCILEVREDLQKGWSHSITFGGLLFIAAIWPIYTISFIIVKIGFFLNDIEPSKKLEKILVKLASKTIKK